MSAALKERPPVAIYDRPWLYPAQSKAIFECLDIEGNPARYAVIEASTKAGKTVGCAAWIVEQAIMNGGVNRNFWWIAPVYPQAKIAYRRIKAGLPIGSFVANEQDLTIRLIPTFSTIWFKSGEKPDNLYGEDVYAAVIDEGSRLREEAWIAVRSTLTATRGPIRIIGNVKGRSNWHYRLARKAEAGAIGYAYAKLTAYDAVAGGVLDAAEIEDAKRALPEAVFRELYLAEPSDDGGNPFGLKHIDACIAPLSTSRPEAIGIDLAKSHDWCVAIGLDRNGQCCGFERWQAPWETTERKILDLIAHVPTLIDSTGVGDPIVERLQSKRHSVEGYKFSSQSKQRLMEGLAVAIQSGGVKYPDGPIKHELDVFEYKYTRTGAVYSAPEGLHDDCVVALALAVEQLRIVNPHLINTRPAGNERVSPWISAEAGED
ncbi:hypothetical protein UFOVP119_39 [uncultured Caudovirales phage]|uniref:Terminase n=1 Tax=uncultured Caudovirales phage TaxID=2100421 RepID=A0A6J5L8S6_9CAUD|nr:hypothetical protein UFOVP119_39 [uncultured Caudovirales phage]